MRAENEIRLERQDVAAHALEIVFERVGLGSGVDDLDFAAARGMLVEQVLQQLGPGLFAIAQRRPEGLRLAERDNAERVALVARYVRPAKAKIVDPDRGVEHTPRAAGNLDEGQLLLRVRRIDRRPYAVVADPLVEIIEPPGCERGRVGVRGAIGIGRRGGRRDQRQSGRAAVESVDERQREREQKERARRHSGRAGRMWAHCLRKRKDENRRRDEQRIERIGLVGHEGVASEHAVRRAPQGQAQ